MVTTMVLWVSGHELYIVCIVFAILFKQLGMLNVIEAMELAPELVYPIYVAACSDRYSFALLLYAKIFIFV